MNTEIRKGAYGWQAETHVELDGGLWLDITTLKTNGGIRSRAQCYRIQNGAMTYVLFGDYSAILATSPARCTEKAVAEQHQRALARLDSVKAAVAKFYAAKGE